METNTKDTPGIRNLNRVFQSGEIKFISGGENYFEITLFKNFSNRKTGFWKVM